MNPRVFIWVGPRPSGESANWGSGNNWRIISGEAASTEGPVYDLTVKFDAPASLARLKQPDSDGGGCSGA